MASKTLKGGFQRRRKNSAFIHQREREASASRIEPSDSAWLLRLRKNSNRDGLCNRARLQSCRKLLILTIRASAPAQFQCSQSPFSAASLAPERCFFSPPTHTRDRHHKLPVAAMLLYSSSRTNPGAWHHNRQKYFFRFFYFFIFLRFPQLS